MTDKIDLESSIKNERLSYIGTLGQMLGIYYSSFIGCIGTITFFCLILLNTFYIDYPLPVIVILVLLTIFVVINSYFIEKLYIIKGLDKESNAAFLTKILQDNYPKIEINRLNNQLLVGRASSSFIVFDRKYTILFDNECVAINLSVFGKGEIKFCLIALYNYYKCKRMLKAIKHN